MLLVDRLTAVPHFFLVATAGSLQMLRCAGIALSERRGGYHRKFKRGFVLAQLERDVAPVSVHTLNRAIAIACMAELQ